MSRSIGDAVGKQVGIIATPVCTEWKLGNKEQFLVIASDGV